MAQAIVTQYRAPTNTRGSRIVVKSWQGVSAHAWDYSIGDSENHAKAIKEHVEKISKDAGVSYKIIGDTENNAYWNWMGNTPDQTGCVAVVI